jgi:hypothetical protein
MKTVKLVFSPSAADDVVSYVLSWEGGSEEYLLANIPVNEDGNLEITLNDISPPLDGVYTFSIVAVDDAGNKSTPSVIEGVVVDFLAPDAPGPISVVVS